MKIDDVENSSFSDCDFIKISLVSSLVFIYWITENSIYFFQFYAEFLWQN
jgi:hypothetical protein